MALCTSTGEGQYVASERHCAATGRYRSVGAARAVIVHNGRGETALSGMPPNTEVRTVVETGAPVMYADFVDGKQWGNDTVQARISSLWAYAQSAFGAKSDKVCLYGISMGGLCALNWAHANLAKVAAVALLIPAVDPGDIYDNNRTSSLGFTASADIDAAYGGAGSFSGTVRSTHNPSLYPADFAGIPMQIWYSGNDPVCLPALATAFAAGAGCPAVNIGNNGHSGGSSPTMLGQIAAFLARYV